MLKDQQEGVTSYKLQAIGCKLQAASCKLQATSYELPATSYKLQATGYKLQVLKDQQEAMAAKLSAAGIDTTTYAAQGTPRRPDSL